MGSLSKKFFNFFWSQQPLPPHPAMEPPSDGMCLLDQILPQAEILAEILHFLDLSDLTRNCPLVCAKWNAILKENSFWLEHCLLNNIPLPPRHLRSQHKFDFKLIFVKKPYGRNLVNNPSGKEGLNGWILGEERHGHFGFGGGKWIIEEPPLGADTDGFPVCFASTYRLCSKHQIIDLVQEGCDPVALDEHKPKITVSEWHAARWDCGADYRFSAELLDSEGKPVGFQKFEVNVITEQWQGREWSEVSHSFTDYPEGVSKVLIQTQAKDTQFWAGHYGPKTARANVCITFNSEK